MKLRAPWAALNKLCVCVCVFLDAQLIVNKLCVCVCVFLDAQLIVWDAVSLTLS